MNTPESCSFWVTDIGNISFSTQIQCFHQVLASWLSSISLLELKIFLLTTPPCHTSKVASWHVDCRYELHFWYYLSKILSKSWKTCEKLWFEQLRQILPVFGLYSIFCLGRTKNEVHIFNLYAKTQLLMYDKGGCQQKIFNSRRKMEDSQEARTWWKQWIWVEKLIFPVSVTQKEQLLGVFIFEFNFDANLAPHITLYY